MITETTLERIEAQIIRLTPQDQLKLLARITERLSNSLPALPTPVVDREAKRQKQHEVEALLAELDAVAELWEGEFDSAEDIRRIREERDNQLWSNKS